GITKRRLEAELAALRSSQKLPWVECDPARALGLVAEALALHRAQGTAPPDAFARWSRLFVGADLPQPPPLTAADPALGERAAAAGLRDPDVDPPRHPFARALARRALELAAEVASGRLRASDVSRKVHPVE